MNENFVVQPWTIIGLTAFHRCRLILGRDSHERTIKLIILLLYGSMSYFLLIITYNPGINVNLQ